MTEQGSTPTPLPKPPPLLVAASEAARLCGVSRASWWSLHSAAKVPFPIRLGRRTLWRVAELAEWVEAGCPPRHVWEERKGLKP